MTLLSRLFGRPRPVSLHGFTDWHCHLLPGVDDGVETEAETLAILDRYAAVGVADVWLTPHIMEDVPNTTAALRERYAALCAAYRGPVRLHLAAENMMDSLFAERLAAGDLLPLGDDGRTLLVETSYYSAPMRFEQTIAAIRAAGFFPLLAHPERYNYITTMRQYRNIKQMGVLFQLNLMSPAGYYGPDVRRKARALLSAGMYDRVGTDLHRAAHLDFIATMPAPRGISLS